ncbi:hypothetical protein PVK06_040709 [Gossypium arboreum]|uniref:Uncharacterized protein n=1 Tax=Gossypium arboreum TaxID=29729 RepID=A0ABR0N672_GOSAR|nr:hypothetical protein PVK06_040709 [Gossypium arboreum]
MSKNVTSCIIELSNIMKAICGKVLDVEELEKVQDRAALTLCNLEKIFPPSFFTIMVYLVIHLPHEAILGGPVFYRWMFLSKLKSYCRNKRYPEGSIVEGYLAEEYMTFCSRYLEDVETRLNRPSRNAGLNDHNLVETYLFQSYGKPIGKVEIAELDDISWIQAHRYVLFHHNSIEPLHKYSAFLINGYRFHTKYRERIRRTQNCGIVVNSSIISYASARDSNPVEANVDYCGLLTDIIELDYYGRWKVVLFRCDWVDVNTARGIKKDQFGFTMVNFSRLIHTGQQLMDEPYVFSSQVKQVFYSKDPTDEGWYVVLRNTPRDLFDMGNGSRYDIVERSETLPFPEQNLDANIPSTRKMRGRRLRDLSIVQNTPNSEEANSEQQTVVGSSNVPETLDEPAKFQNLYELNLVERVKVSRNNHGQPVGFATRLLEGYLGIIARNANMLPINYESWHHMPDSNKNQALDNIKERFALEVSDDYIKKALGKKWRDHKTTLKKLYFKKDISLEEKLRNVPPGMLRYQWEDDRERVGTSSRQKQKFTHTAGSRSFASVAEAEEVSSGQKVGRLQLFEITHRKKDGSPMTSEAGEIMEKLKEKKVEYEAIASTDSSINFENIDNRIITEVLGPERYGRVRSQGLVLPRPNILDPAPSNTCLSGVKLKQKFRVEREGATATREAATTAREAEAVAMAVEQSRKYDELQLQLQQMMQMFQKSQKPPF